MKVKAKVIINEQHSLLPEQEKLLNERFCNNTSGMVEGWELLKVPAEGWTKDVMDKMLSDGSLTWACVFVSPIPYLIKEIAFASGQNAPYSVLVFHNDKREKKEINGKVIYTTPSEGWELI